MILPYIDKVNTPTNTAPTDNSTSSQATIDSFREILVSAERTAQAMAVDALIEAGNSGSVSPETIQKILGFNPQPNLSVSSASATNTSSASSATGSSSSSSSNPASTDLDAYFEEAAATYNVDVNLLKAIARAESNYNPNATSSAGAMGVMQLMPSTAKSLGITDAYNAHDNIMGGAKVISQHLSRYNGDISLALAAYNAGSGNVEKYGGIPPFTETQNYVKKVLAYYEGA